MTRMSTLIASFCVCAAVGVSLWIAQFSAGQALVQPVTPPSPKVGKYQIATSSGAPGVINLYMCDTENGQLWSYNPSNQKWTTMPTPIPQSTQLVPKK